MVRNFDTRRVDPDVVDRVLSNALHAPSAGFSQGWAFLLLDTPAEVEEERRLFYVAVTRAREELLLLHGGRRMQRGQLLPCLPSRFLDEIPDGMLDVVDRTGEAVHEEEATYRVEETAFRAGDRVRHHHFGLGHVVAVRSLGGGTRVTVEFGAAGRRDLLLSYARLERV